MAKQEARLKSELRRLAVIMLQGFVVQRHEDVRYEGVPDFSFTGCGKTTWWEVKHATPDISDKENQRINCHKLAAAGFCRYIIYWENQRGENKRTLIVHPDNLKSLEPDNECPGHNHEFVVTHIKRIHCGI